MASISIRRRPLLDCYTPQEPPRLTRRREHLDRPAICCTPACALLYPGLHAARRQLTVAGPPTLGPGRVSRRSERPCVTRSLTCARRTSSTRCGCSWSGGAGTPRFPSLREYTAHFQGQLAPASARASCCAPGPRSIAGSSFLGTSIDSPQSADHRAGSRRAWSCGWLCSTRYSRAAATPADVPDAQSRALEATGPMSAFTAAPRPPRSCCFAAPRARPANGIDGPHDVLVRG